MVRINPDRNKGMFDFDEGRLTIVEVPGAVGRISSDGDGRNPDPFPVYHPHNLKAPYVYFDSRTYSSRRFYTATGHGAVAAYASTRMAKDPVHANRQVPEWINKTTFQIISAGLDDHYGSFPSLAAIADLIKIFPTGMSFNHASHSMMSTGYTGPPGDEDNISNFSDGREFGGHMP